MEASVRNDDELSSLSRAILKSKISNPTRYSVQHGSTTGIVKNERSKQSTGPADPTSNNEIDSYMNKLNNRYVSAVEN